MLTVAEVAVILRVSRGAVYDAIKNGELACVKIGKTIRIHPNHLLAMGLPLAVQA